MTTNNTLPHDAPQLKEILLEFPDSTSSMCDMMDVAVADALTCLSSPNEYRLDAN